MSTTDKAEEAARTWAMSLGGAEMKPKSDEGGGATIACAEEPRHSKSASRAVWRQELAAFEVLQPRGDALRSMGSFWDRRTFLHAEEGLWLAERGLLAVNDGPPASLHCVAPDAAGGAANSTSAGAIAAKGIGGAAKSSFLSAYSLWETLSWSGVPWECYRAYAELKRRSYVIRRRPEDSVGGAEDTPRAAPLSCFRTMSTRRATKSADLNVERSDFHGDAVRKRSSDFLPIAFHAYAPPNATFRKRDPGRPDFLVVVCRFADEMPTHTSLVALVRSHNIPISGVTLASREIWNARSNTVDAAGVGSNLAQESSSSASGIAQKGKGIEANTHGGVGSGLDGGKWVEMKPQGDDGERLCTGRIGVKLAVVTREGEVHLFDVDLHKPDERYGNTHHRDTMWKKTRNCGTHGCDF